MTFSIFSFFVTLTVALVLVPLAARVGLIDRPEGHKGHGCDMPLVGGLAIYAGLLISLVIFGAANYGDVPLLVGAGLLILAGAIDDFRQLGIGSRFVVQISATLVVVYGAKVHIASLGDLFGSGVIELGVWAIPFTVFAVVGGINAINMADGVDGLAGSLAVVTLTLLAWMVYFYGQAYEMKILVMLIGCVLAFLTFNLRIFGRSRARVFMGDAGSMFLGFVVAWFLIQLSQGDNPVITSVTALWLFAIPLMDTVSIMFRRIQRGHSPFSPDHTHLHHILLRSGLSVNQTVAVITALHGLMGLAGILGLYLGVPEFIMFYSYAAIFVLYHLTVLRVGQSIKLHTIMESVVDSGP